MDQILTHAADALARFAEEFKGGANWTLLLNTLTARTQTLENVYWALFTERFIEGASGSQLDDLGAIVGATRDASTDAEYRLRLKATIRANASDGTIEEVLAVVRLIVGSTPTLQIQNGFPAEFELNLLDQAITESTAEIVASLVAKARAAGVRANVVWQSGDTDDTFTLAISTSLSGDYDSPGGSSVPVFDTSDFPDTGDIIFGYGSAEEEVLPYTGKTPTSFIVEPGNAVFSHGADTLIVLSVSDHLGLGDSTNAATGGKLTGVFDG